MTRTLAFALSTCLVTTSCAHNPARHPSPDNRELLVKADEKVALSRGDEALDEQDFYELAGDHKSVEDIDASRSSGERRQKIGAALTVIGIAAAGAGGNGGTGGRGGQVTVRAPNAAVARAVSVQVGGGKGGSGGHGGSGGSGGGNGSCGGTAGHDGSTGQSGTPGGDGARRDAIVPARDLVEIARVLATNPALTLEPAAKR